MSSAIRAIHRLKDKRMGIEKKLHNRLFLHNLKKYIFPDISEDGSVIVDYFIRIIFFLYPLFLIKDDSVSTFPVKIILLTVLLLLTGVLYGYVLLFKRATYGVRLRSMDIAMLFVTGLLMVKVVNNTFINNTNIKQEIFFLCLIGIYFLTRAVNKGYTYYLNLLLFSAAILYIGLFEYYLMGQITILDAEEMFLQPEGLRSYLILTSSIAILFYCLTEKVYLKYFYLIMTISGFTLILLDGDAIGVCITGFFILLIPIIFTPTAEFIKRNLNLLFLYLFLISNIPLLQYLEWFKVEQAFDIHNGLYIDLFFALLGVCILIYWKKVPANINPEKIIMKKFQRFYKKTMVIAGVTIAICILIGNKMAAFSDIFGMKALKEFCASLWTSINDNDSFFSLILQSYGVVGGIISIILVILLAGKLWKRLKCNDVVVKMLSILSCLFLIQSFFYKIQTISTPLYMVLLTLALFAEQTKTYDRR